MEEYRVSPDKLTRLPVGERVVVSGSRTFDIPTQAIEFPKIAEFRKTDFPTKLPAGITTLDLEGQCEKFLIGMRDPTPASAPEAL